MEKIPSTLGLVPFEAPRMNASPRPEIHPTGSRYTRSDWIATPCCPVRRLGRPRPLSIKRAPLSAETAVKTRFPAPASSRFRSRSLFAVTSQAPGVASGRRLRLPLGTRATLLSFKTLTREKKHEFRTPTICAFRPGRISSIFTTGCTDRLTAFPQLFQHSDFKTLFGSWRRPFSN